MKLIGKVLGILLIGIGIYDLDLNDGPQTLISLSLIFLGIYQLSEDAHSELAQDVRTVMLRTAVVAVLVALVMRQFF